MDVVKSTLVRLCTLSLIYKPMKYVLDNWSVRWTENWLNFQTRRLAIRTTKSRRTPVCSAVLQGWILGPAVLNIFLNDLNGGPGCTLSKFAGDTKLGQVVDMPDR